MPQDPVRSGGEGKTPRPSGTRPCPVGVGSGRYACPSTSQAEVEIADRSSSSALLLWCRAKRGRAHRLRYTEGFTATGPLMSPESLFTGWNCDSRCRSSMYPIPACCSDPNPIFEHHSNDQFHRVLEPSHPCREPMRLSRADWGRPVSPPARNRGGALAGGSKVFLLELSDWYACNNSGSKPKEMLKETQPKSRPVVGM